MSVFLPLANPLTWKIRGDYRSQCAANTFVENVPGMRCFHLCLFFLFLFAVFFLSFISSCFFSNRHIQSHLSGSVIKTSRLNSPRRCECHVTSRTLPRLHHHPIHTQIAAAAGRDSVLMRPRSGHDPALTPFPCAAAV